MLITQLFPHAALAGEDLELPSHSDRSGRLHVRDTLVLLPLVAPADSCGWTDDYREHCLSVRYTLPAAWRLLDGTHPPGASLAALLGPQRAKILRWLERPATAGGVADLLHGAPSMATHHLRALEASGLVTRTREGRTVRVHRTARGSALVGLYDDA